MEQNLPIAKVTKSCFKPLPQLSHVRPKHVRSVVILQLRSFSGDTHKFGEMVCQLCALQVADQKPHFALEGKHTLQHVTHHFTFSLQGEIQGV